MSKKLCLEVPDKERRGPEKRVKTERVGLLNYPCEIHPALRSGWIRGSLPLGPARAPARPRPLLHSGTSHRQLLYVKGNQNTHKLGTQTWRIPAEKMHIFRHENVSQIFKSA